MPEHSVIHSGAPPPSLSTRSWLTRWSLVSHSRSTARIAAATYTGGVITGAVAAHRRGAAVAVLQARCCRRGAAGAVLTWCRGSG